MGQENPGSADQNHGSDDLHHERDDDDDGRDESAIQDDAFDYDSGDEEEEVIADVNSEDLSATLNLMVASHVEMLQKLERLYPNRETDVFVGIGGSPELLVEMLGAAGRKTGLVPVSNMRAPLEISESIESDNEAGGFQLNAQKVIADIIQYMKSFIPELGNGKGYRIILLDFVSTGTSLEGAARFVSKIFPAANVIKQALAMDAPLEGFKLPLIENNAFKKLLKEDKTKRLTRTVPKVSLCTRTFQKGLTETYERALCRTAKNNASRQENLDIIVRRVMDETRSDAYIAAYIADCRRHGIPLDCALGMRQAMRTRVRPSGDVDSSATSSRP